MNGIDITFIERPPDAYAAQFNSGEFQVGGSASVLILGLGATRGIKTSYLFNLFDYWGTVVTSRPEIKSLADLAGKQVAAAKGTTNYTMFAWFAKQQGGDPRVCSRLSSIRQRPSLVGYALADRAWTRCSSGSAGLYAGQGAAPGHSHHRSQHCQKPGAPMPAAAMLPYLGVAAHQEWIDTHRDLIPVDSIAAYKQAAAWVVANPADAAPLVAAVKDDAQRAAVAALIRDNSRLALNLQPAGKIAKEIEATYRAGLDVGLFKEMPPAASVYSGEME